MDKGYKILFVAITLVLFLIGICDAIAINKIRVQLAALEYKSDGHGEFSTGSINITPRNSTPETSPSMMLDLGQQPLQGTTYSYSDDTNNHEKLELPEMTWLGALGSVIYWGLAIAGGLCGWRGNYATTTLRRATLRATGIALLLSAAPAGALSPWWIHHELCSVFDILRICGG